MADDMRERISKINGYFRAYNIKKQDIKQEAREPAKLPQHNFNSRGEEMLTPKQIR
jgi:hypothetical protein